MSRPSASSPSCRELRIRQLGQVFIGYHSSKETVVKEKRLLGSKEIGAYRHRLATISERQRDPRYDALMRSQHLAARDVMVLAEEVVARFRAVAASL